MNEQLQHSLTEILEKVTTGAKTASNFLIEETPEVVRELLLWYGVKSFIYFVLALSILLIWFLYEKWLLGWCKSNLGTCGEPWFFIYIIAGSAPRGVMLITFLIIFNIEWLQIWLAPKIWLIEYTTKLVQG